MCICTCTCGWRVSTCQVYNKLEFLGIEYEGINLVHIHEEICVCWRESEWWVEIDPGSIWWEGHRVVRYVLRWRREWVESYLHKLQKTRDIPRGLLCAYLYPFEEEVKERLVEQLRGVGLLSLYNKYVCGQEQEWNRKSLCIADIQHGDLYRYLLSSSFPLHYISQYTVVYVEEDADECIERVWRTERIVSRQPVWRTGGKSWIDWILSENKQEEFYSMFLSFFVLESNLPVFFMYFTYLLVNEFNMDVYQFMEKISLSIPEKYRAIFIYKVWTIYLLLIELCVEDSLMSVQSVFISQRSSPTTFTVSWIRIRKW